MTAIRELASSIQGALVELVRPGEGAVSGPELARLGRVAVTVTIVVTNLIGAAAVVVIATLVVPMPPVAHSDRVQSLNLIAAGAYIALAFPVGVALGTRGMLRLRRWLHEDRPATLSETRILLHAPARLFALQVALWLGAAVLFGALDLHVSGAAAVRLAITVAITGVVTAACAYLLTELLLRPAAARALEQRAPGRLAVPGVATRAVLAWLLGTGLPLFGLVGIGMLALLGARGTSARQLGIAMVVLGGTGIAVGLLAVTVAARATADPVESVRRALARVKQGDFDVRVPVYDGTQIGQLQLGFNEMVAGLAERERIRQAFGTYVDPDIAEHILRHGTDLGGEELDVTIMFIDVRDFTAFAATTPADRVVGAINHLFEQIVPVVHEHGGHIDKFVGDGLLAVFGAPQRRADHADQALGAALQIARTARSPEGLTIGIGLNSGTVVAGNVGGAGRFEFSVIGDPVNVAARIEAATRQTGDTILLSERTRELLASEHPELVERRDVDLKGLQDPIRLYAPGERQARAQATLA